MPAGLPTIFFAEATPGWEAGASLNQKNRVHSHCPYQRKNAAHSPVNRTLLLVACPIYSCKNLRSAPCPYKPEPGDAILLFQIYSYFYLRPNFHCRCIFLFDEDERIGKDYITQHELLTEF